MKDILLMAVLVVFLCFLCLNILGIDIVTVNLLRDTQDLQTRVTYLEELLIDCGIKEIIKEVNNGRA